MTYITHLYTSQFGLLDCFLLRVNLLNLISIILILLGTANLVHTLDVKQIKNILHI